MTHEETSVLRRATLSPRQDFLVLALTATTAQEIEKAVLSRVSFHTGILHILIEKAGALAFAAYDNFHDDCIVAYPPIPAAFLEELVTEKVLRSYRRVRLA